MEKISAAQAVEWNVELDRGLRSNKPGAIIEAILKMGPRLQRWSEEPIVTPLTASLFKLDPGQDRAFANSILLRLADAFRTGNNFTRLCVLKIFLLEFRGRHCYKGVKEYKGILAKERVANHLEIMNRVKAVVDSGDVVARALALRTLGCLADLGKDKAEIHRMVVEAMESPYLLEANAALFATGCLCEVSEDFASVILKKLIRMVNAMRTAPDIKIGAVRLFSKMGHSPMLAHAAHEAGKGLMLKLPSNEIVTSMLLSLSKLAAVSVVTLSDQVDLLLSYLSSDPRYIVRAMSLKCFSMLSIKAIRCISLKGKGFTILLSMVKDISLPPSLHCHAFRVLKKLCRHYVACVDACQLLELTAVVEISSLHPNWSKRQAAVSLLVDLVCNIENLRKGLWDEISEQQSAMDIDSEDPWRATDIYRNKDFQQSLPVRVTLLVFDQMTLLCKLLPEEGLQEEGIKHASLASKERLSVLKRECQIMFDLILHLIGECASVRLLVVDCIKGMVEALVKAEVLKDSKHGQKVADESHMGMGVDVKMLHRIEGKLESRECGQKELHISELPLYLCQCLGACLDKLDMNGALDSVIYNKVKQLTKYVAELDPCSSVLCSLIPSVLKSCRARHFALPEKGKLINDRDALYEKNKMMDTDLCVYQDYFWADCEKLTLEVASNMIKGRNLWAAYRIAIHAAYYGAWHAASSTFQYLVNRVQSEACYLWLKSVSLLAEAESKLHFVLVPVHCGDSLNEQGEMADKGKQHSNSATQMPDAGDSDVLCRYSEIFAEVLNLNNAAKNNLAAAVALDRAFEFQRWYLNLWGRLMTNLAELLGLLGTNLSTKENRSDPGETDVNFEEHLHSGWKLKMQSLQSLKFNLFHISFQLQRLASEFDLLNISFMDIDLKSFSSISSVALYCSLMSFCTMFAIHFPKASIGQSKANRGQIDFETRSNGMVIQDLAQRLRQIDGQLWEDLELFSRGIGDVNKCSMVMTQMSGFGHQEKSILSLCKLAISGVLNLQEQAKMMKNEVELKQLWKDGLQFLRILTLKWLHLSSHIPIYFFRTRARIGVELFVANMDNRNPDGLSVYQGLQLPLSLSVQVRNILPGSSLKVRRICCVIIIESSSGLPQGRMDYYGCCTPGCHGEGMEEVLELTEALLLNIRLQGTRSNRISEIKTDVMKLDLDKCNLVDTSHRKTIQKGKMFATFEVNKKGQGFSECLLDVSGLPCGLYQISWHCACLDNRGSYWSLMPLNDGPIFNIKPVHRC